MAKRHRLIRTATKQRERARAGGRPFRKGQSGNPRGRPKGVLSKVTAEARAAATQLVDDQVYREKLRRDLQKRRVGPAMETLLWHYAKGKPVERQEVGKPGEFQNLTNEELKREIEAELAKL